MTTAGVQDVWEPFRAQNGRVFFALRKSDPRKKEAFHSHRWVTTSWDVPQTSGNEQTTVLGDGVLAVNDPGAWEAYKDTKSGRLYYINTVSGESSWRCPPGCQGKAVVNAPESWLTFVSPERGSKRYYLNTVNKEITWHRPVCLGKATDEEEGHDDLEGPTFVSEDGNEFVVPEDNFDLDDEDLDDDAFELEASLPTETEAPNDGSTLGTTLEQEADSPGSPSVPTLAAPPNVNVDDGRLAELQVEFTRKIRARFEELLDERGVQEHSQWVNWFSRLEQDQRLRDVPVEDRARWFRAFTLGLIGKGRAIRKRRKTRCKQNLKSFVTSSERAHDMLREARGDPEHFLKLLESARTEVTELSVDTHLMLRLHNMLQALPKEDLSKLVNEMSTEH